MSPTYKTIQIADIANALVLLSEVYSDARRALAEFVSNSADAFSLAVRGGIERKWKCQIAIKETSKGISRVAVRDNGCGIIFDRLSELPGSVALSLKREDVETKGHKGIGLLAFASFCRRMRIVTRAEGTDETYYAQWDQRCLNDPQGTPVEIDRQDRKGRREPGTDVIFESIFEDRQHQLRPQKIVDFLKIEFAPDLRERRYELIVDDGKRRTQVEPGRYPGTPFDVLRVKTSRAEAIDLDLYLSTRPGLQGVALFVRGKQVIENVVSHPDLSRSPWTSGRVIGEIRCGFVKPVTGRAGGIVPGMEWTRFVEAIRQIESRLEEAIQRLAEEQRARQTHRIFKELNQALSSVWRQLNWEDLPRSSVGGGLPGEVFETGKDGVGGGEGDEIGGKRAGREASSPGKPERPRLIDPARPRPSKAAGGPAVNWREAEFEPDARSLRSRFIPSAALIEINLAHADYIAEREEEVRHRAYLIGLLSKELTLINFGQMGDVEITERMIQLETALSRHFRR